MVRGNLAQESPVGISVKNPGGARFPGITWDWLTTQTLAVQERQGTVHELPTSKCCVLCSLQQLTLAPVTCQLFLPTLLPVDYISSPASSSARHIQEEARQGFFWHISGYSKVCCQLLEVLPCAVQGAAGVEEQEGCPSSPSQVGGWDEGVVPLHSAQVDHGSVVGHLHRLADAGFASLHHLQLVHGVIHAQGKDFVPWQPLPGSLVVKEKDKEEFFSCLCLPLLPQLQDIHGGHRDGDSVVQQTLARHLGVDDQGRVGGITTALGPHQLQGLQLSLALKGHQERPA